MSDLPVVDALKIAQRETKRLRQYYFDALHREAQLEILAETLRDQRDQAIEERDQARNQLGLKLANGAEEFDCSIDTVPGEVVG